MKWLFRIFLSLVLIATLIFIFYCNNLSLVNRQTVSFYKQLKKQLQDHNYKPSLVVISTKRLRFHNSIQVKFSGGASKSKHLDGDAIDFLVFDVNGDGKRNSKDVDIVTALLENEIMQGRGGIGTYKNENSFIDRQMVHIDCRSVMTRWSK